MSLGCSDRRQCQREGSSYQVRTSYDGVYLSFWWGETHALTRATCSYALVVWYMLVGGKGDGEKVKGSMVGGLVMG